MFRPQGVVCWGSIPYIITGFIAFLIVIRALSLMAVQSDKNTTKKGISMDKVKKMTRIVLSSSLETVWAIGVGIIVGQLST